MTGVLRAVFEDGPPNRPTLAISDDGHTSWPLFHDWVSRDQSGVLVLYTYSHIGYGHYRVSKVQSSEGIIDLSPKVGE